MSLWRPDIAPDHEPYSTIIKRGVLKDARRNDRAVPFKVYMPVDHGQDSLPAIIWSHGLGGSADGASFLARYIAGQGYIVINIQHHGTDVSLWEGKPGHPWDVIRATPIPRAAALDRFRDVYFILDQMPSWLRENVEGGDLLDMSRLGMSGHSYGALTTQVMAGQGFPDMDGTLITMPEERFRAGILYSPVPIHYMTDAPDAEIYGTIAMPLLHFTGTADESPVEKFGYEKRVAIFDHSGGAEQYLVVLSDGDHMVFSGSRGQLAENPKRRAHEDIIKIVSLAFWDAYLKGDEAARTWLKTDGAAAWNPAEIAAKYRS